MVSLSLCLNLIRFFRYLKILFSHVYLENCKLKFISAGIISAIYLHDESHAGEIFFSLTHANTERM